MHEAEFYVETAKMFGCLPTDIMDAPAENLQMLRIVQMGTRPQQQEMEMEEEWQIPSQ